MSFERRQRLVRKRKDLGSLGISLRGYTQSQNTPSLLPVRIGDAKFEHAIIEDLLLNPVGRTIESFGIDLRWFKTNTLFDMRIGSRSRHPNFAETNH